MSVTIDLSKKGSQECLKCHVTSISSSGNQASMNIIARLNEAKDVEFIIQNDSENQSSIAVTHGELVEIVDFLHDVLGLPPI